MLFTKNKGNDSSAEGEDDSSQKFESGSRGHLSPKATTQDPTKLSILKLLLFVYYDFSLILGLMYGMGLLLPTHVAQMVAPSEKAFLLATAGILSAVIGIICSFSTGILSDRIKTRMGKRKPAVLIGTLMMSMCLGVRGLLTDLKQLATFKIVLYIMLYCVETAGMSIAIAGYRSLLPEVIPASQMGIASGMVGFASALGIVVGTLGFGAVYGLVPLWINIVVLMVMIWSGSLVLLVSFKEPDENYSNHKNNNNKIGVASINYESYVTDGDEQDHEEDELDKFMDSVLNEEQAPIESKSESWKQKLLRVVWHENPLVQWNFLCSFLSRFMFYCTLMTIQGYLIYFFTDTFHMQFSILFWNNVISSPVRASSVYTSTQFISSLFTTAFCGSISHKVGKKTVVYVSTAIIVCTASVQAFTRSYSLSLVLSIFTGLGLGMFQAIDLSITIDSLQSKSNIARDLAIAHLAMSVPKMITSPLIGLIIGAFDKLFEQNIVVRTPHFGYTVVFLMAACFMMLSALFISLVRIPKSSRTKVQPVVN